MKGFTITVLLFCISSKVADAQSASTEKSYWGIHAGIYPLSVYNEFMYDDITMRAELGSGFAWSSGGGIKSSNIELYPSDF